MSAPTPETTPTTTPSPWPAPFTRDEWVSILCSAGFGGAAASEMDIPVGVDYAMTAVRAIRRALTPEQFAEIMATVEQAASAAVATEGQQGEGNAST